MAYRASHLDRQKELIAALLSHAWAGIVELEVADPDEMILNGKENFDEE